jgi:probable addiction module antidote protein
MKTRRFDAANYINTPEDVVEYLNAVLEENDPAALTQALGTVARSEGMTSIAERTGLKSEGLYKSLGEGGNPSFATVSKVLAACGLRLQIARNDDRDAVMA